jgi:drug/metabolite transporter (DMT)-like permease
MGIRRMNVKEWALLLLLAALWGGSFIFTSAAITGFSVLTLAWCRVFISGLLVWGLALMFKAKLPDEKGLIGKLVLLSITGNVLPFIFIFWGQKEVPGSLAAILNATAPLFTLVFAHLFTKDERMTGTKLVGAMVGLGGVVLIIGPAALGHLGESVWSQLSVICGSGFYALSGIVARWLRSVPFLLLAALQLTVSTIILAPLVLILEPPWLAAMPGMDALLGLFGLTVLSTCLAYIVYFRLLSTAGATNLSLVGFISPAWAILMGNLLLDERLRPLHFVGLAIIVAGLAIVDGRAVRYLASRWRRA